MVKTVLAAAIGIMAYGALGATDAHAAYTAFTFTSAQGDYVGGGTRRMIRPVPFTFEVSRQYDNGVHFSITDFAGPSPSYSFWYADFAGPSRATLVPGTYLNATRWPFQVDGVPGLAISGDGRGCNTLYGRFDVYEATYDPATQAVISFAADFEQHCEAITAPPLRGSIRYNTNVPLSRRKDLLLDFGSTFGVYGWTSGTWAAVHPFSPEAMAAGDFDGNGQTDAVFDFPGYGLWARYNGATWRQLHPLSVTKLTVGDLDGNGRDDVIVSFAGYGVYVWKNDSTWVGLSSQTPSHMITADLDGNGRADLVLDVPGLGLWTWSNDSTWAQLHNANVAAMVAGDLDGNGRVDLVLDFPGYGLWLWFSNTAWIPVHSQSPRAMTTGDVDGNLKDDLIVDFAGYGVFAFMNNTSWSTAPQTGLVPDHLATADLDGTGQAALIGSFTGGGVNIWRSATGWVSLHPYNVDGIAVGDFDGR